MEGCTFGIPCQRGSSRVENSSCKTVFRVEERCWERIKTSKMVVALERQGAQGRFSCRDMGDGWIGADRANARTKCCTASLCCVLLPPSTFVIKRAA